MFLGAVDLPLNCTKCGRPVTVAYMTERGHAQVANHYECPHCRQDIIVTLPGVLVDSWPGHGSDMDRPKSR